MALLWIGSFGCYIAGLGHPIYGMIAVMLAVATPFFAARRLRHFRDFGLEGIISMRRGWGLLLAIAQYAYFAFLDHGFLMDTIEKMLHSPETEQMLKQAGMKESIEENLAQLQAMRPIDIALNVLTTNILIGMVLGLPIAASMRRIEKLKN